MSKPNFQLTEEEARELLQITPHAAIKDEVGYSDFEESCVHRFKQNGYIRKSAIEEAQDAARMILDDEQDLYLAESIAVAKGFFEALRQIEELKK